MAKTDDLDLDIASTVKKPSGNKKKLIVIILSALLGLSAVGSAVYYFMSKGKGSESSSTASQKADKKSVKAEEKVNVADQTFDNLDPPFVVNFSNSTRPRFLQVSISVMVHSPETVEQLKKVDPLIRNNVLMVLSGRNPTDLASREGREALRLAVRDEIQKVMLSRFQEKGVDDVLFTGFVMQ